MQGLNESAAEMLGAWAATRLPAPRTPLQMGKALPLLPCKNHVYQERTGIMQLLLEFLKLHLVL